MADILFLAHRAPWPPNRGDRIRSWHVLQHLARNARVHLLAFADSPEEAIAAPELRAATASCELVLRRKANRRAAVEALASGRPVSLAAFDAPAMHHAMVDALLARRYDAIYVFSGQMAQYLPAATAAPVVMDFVDVDSAKFAQWGGERGGPVGWMMRREARLLGAFEGKVARRSAASLFVSAAEAEVFRAATGAPRVQAMENGIDAEHFRPGTVEPVVHDGRLIVFTGQMDYRPNVEAVTWFARALLPQVRAVHPDARFAIVGRAPAPEVKALAGEAVIVTGEVDDVRGWLAAADVVVAPLKLARGIQNKVLEAMAMARPVVASSAAAEGIDHGGAIAVGADGAALVGEVNRLLGDLAAAVALGQAARERVLSRYAWQAALAPLDALVTPPVRVAA